MIPVAVALALVWSIGVSAGPAPANGGAYIVVEGTHHLVGATAEAELEVSIPAGRRALLDEGPFHAYLVPGGRSIPLHGPLPAGAVRLGTFAVRETSGGAVLTASITMPDVEGGYYAIGLCDDPCTTAGFGETATGDISIVATAREAMLLTELARAESGAERLRRTLRRTTKDAEAEAAVTDAALARSEAAGTELTERVDRLEGELAVERARSEAAAGRIEPLWAIVGALALAAIAALVAARRAGRRPSGRPGGEPQQPGSSRSLVGNAAANAGASGSPPNAVSPASSSRVADERAAATSSSE
jgi:hypothetical protein